MGRRTNDRLLKEVSRLQTQLGTNNRLVKDVSRPKTQSEAKEPNKGKIQNIKKSSEASKKKRKKSLKSNTMKVKEEKSVTLEVKKEILDDVKDTNVTISAEENSPLERSKSLPAKPNYAPTDLKIKEEIMLEEIRDEIKMEISDDDFGCEDQNM